VVRNSQGTGIEEGVLALKGSWDRCGSNGMSVRTDRTEETSLSTWISLEGEVPVGKPQPRLVWCLALAGLCSAGTGCQTAERLGVRRTEKVAETPEKPAPSWATEPVEPTTGKEKTTKRPGWLARLRRPPEKTERFTGASAPANEPAAAVVLLPPVACGQGEASSVQQVSGYSAGAAERNP
jgi:hypothetical protein